MCDCNKKIVDLSHLKIYTIMATYKARLSSGSTYKGDLKLLGQQRHKKNWLMLMKK